MPRPTYNRPYQPVNKPQGGGVPAIEGRPVDARLTLGCFMQAAVEAYADIEGVSQSAFIRNCVRAELERRGTEFK
jgi:hypothetical protein